VTDALRGGLIGCGFFASNHLNGWGEVDGADIVAVCDLDRKRAEDAAHKWEIPGIYTDPDEMLERESLDFVDIVTQPATHRELVELVARDGVDVICQKPMAPNWTDARAIVNACEKAGIRLMIHENFRWQRPMRAVKAASQHIGDLFFGQISFRSAWDVYATQPYLATDNRFIIYDLGVHLLDLARFFLGEVRQLTCRTQRVNQNIRAEDVATILLNMENGATVIVDLSYASQLDDEVFPQTLVRLEGTNGSVTLDRDYSLTVVTNDGVETSSVPPPEFAWSTPPATNIQESVVAIQQHWVDAIRGGSAIETSGKDNLRTVELVFGSYLSAETGQPFLTGSLD
jgi:D-apiose dehydrogenase